MKGSGKIKIEKLEMTRKTDKIGNTEKTGRKAGI
jgi:hypothetical protein